MKKGDILKIHKAGYEFIVEIRLVAAARGPASIAESLYQETEESLQKRQTLAEQRRIEHASAPRTVGKPSKRDRRNIIKFTRS